MKAWMGLALAVLLAVMVAYFVAANQQPVPVRLLGVTLEEPLWMALLVAVLAGAAVALGACSWSILRLKLQARRQIKRIADLEQEIHGLRTLPIASASAIAGASSAPKA
jgi:uncharacterized integral membrane protein